jgi:YD repeat-containing protein
LIDSSNQNDRLPQFAFTYRADGMLTKVNEDISVGAPGHDYVFSYGTHGLLEAPANSFAKNNPWRNVAIPATTQGSVSQGRDEQGRLVSWNTVVGSSSTVEQLQYWADSKIQTYSGGVRNWTYTYDGAVDSAHFDQYGPSRLTIEQGSDVSALTYDFDLSVAGGIGVRTSFSEAVAGSTPEWDYKAIGANPSLPGAPSGVDGFARTLSEQAGESGSEVDTTIDGRGNVVLRKFNDGRQQTLTWDPLGRLVQVAQIGTDSTGTWQPGTWTAVYDGLNRRVRTVWMPTAGSAVTTDSWYDPQVEFLEIAVAVNDPHPAYDVLSSSRVWKVYGPDLNGTYGGLQGVGGLEAFIMESGPAVGVGQDALGDCLQQISGAVKGSVSVKTSGLKV